MQVMANNENMSILCWQLEQAFGIQTIIYSVCISGIHPQFYHKLDSKEKYPMISLAANSREGYNFTRNLIT